MEKLPQRVYTTEFRAQAVQMILRDGLGVSEVARRLSMSPKTLANWLKRAKDGEPSASDTGAAMAGRAATDAEAENARLRRENAELRMERDILRKATACFATESLRGAR